MEVSDLGEKMCPILTAGVITEEEEVPCAREDCKLFDTEHLDCAFNTQTNMLDLLLHRM